MSRIDNDQCRGRVLVGFLGDVADKRNGNQGSRTASGNKWQGLKGMFYMGRDLFRTSRATDAERKQGDEWAMWDGTHDFYGSLSTPDDFDFEDRPGLGSSGANGLPGSKHKLYAEYARYLEDNADFRGFEGVIFDS